MWHVVVLFNWRAYASTYYKSLSQAGGSLRDWSSATKYSFITCHACRQMTRYCCNTGVMFFLTLITVCSSWFSSQYVVRLHRQIWFLSKQMWLFSFDLFESFCQVKGEFFTADKQACYSYSNAVADCKPLRWFYCANAAHPRWTISQMSWSTSVLEEVRSECPSKVLMESGMDRSYNNTHWKLMATQDA